MKSRADSTARRYIKEIQKFIAWCKSRNISVKLPFSVSVVSVYMARVYKDSKSYASFVLVHAGLKWFHSFIPDDVQNTLDSSICHNFLEAAKHRKSSPVVKKLKSKIWSEEYIDFGSLIVNPTLDNRFQLTFQNVEGCPPPHWH